MRYEKDVTAIVDSYHQQGYNCAEAMLRGFHAAWPLELDDNGLKIASGFGGGIGRSGCLCGALSGAIMVLSLLKGRTSNAEDKAVIYALVEEFHRSFKDKFGVTCCNALNPYPFLSTEQKANCQRIVKTTAAMLQQFIQQKGLQ